MDSDAFVRAPLSFFGPIPVFSEFNDYTDNYQRISADHLEAHDKTGENPWIPEELWVELEQSTLALIQKYAHPGDKILDVGVGTGRLLSTLPSLQKYGLDISLNYLTIAQTKGIEVCYALVEDMPFKEDFFDVVVCTDVLEHVLNLDLAITKILSVLKKGGVLLVRVPYREDLSLYVDPACPYKYIHVRNFDEHSLRLLFEKIFHCEFLGTSLTGLVPWRLKFPEPFPKAIAIFARLLNLVKRMSLPVYKAIHSTFYYPLEINVAVRKQ